MLSTAIWILQSFNELAEKPLLVDLTIEEGQRLKVIYGSSKGFHAIDLDTSNVFEIYIPSHVSGTQGIDSNNVSMNYTNHTNHTLLISRQIIVIKAF